MSVNIKLLNLLIVLISVYIASAQALEIQPIIGFEQVRKTDPVDRTKSRLIYGLRVLVGPRILSAEAEVTTGQDKEEFNDLNLTLKETVYNGMLGIRSTVDLMMLSVYARAGGHIRKREIERVENGITTTEKPATYISPYAGAGLYLGPGPFKVHAGVTAIFTGRPKSSDIEYQYTLGASINF